MAFEKKMAAVPPHYLTSDGGQTGKITVSDTSLFKVKQEVILIRQDEVAPNFNPPVPIELEIKRILDSTTMIVGPRKANINQVSDVSAYTTVLQAYIFAPEQKRGNTPEQEIPVVAYEEEPTVAHRIIQVDKYGNRYDQQNRAPVDPGGQQMSMLINLLNIQVTGVDPTLYLVNNDGFFIFDNAGNFIKAG